MDRTKNRSDKYQHLLLESQYSPDMMSEFSGNKTRSQERTLGANDKMGMPRNAQGEGRAQA